MAHSLCLIGSFIKPGESLIELPNLNAFLRSAEREYFVLCLSVYQGWFIKATAFKCA